MPTPYRPPCRAEAPSHPETVRLSPDERELVERAARVNRQTKSQFCRDAIVTAAEECLEGLSSDGP